MKAKPNCRYNTIYKAQNKWNLNQLKRINGWKIKFIIKCHSAQHADDKQIGGKATSCTEFFAIGEKEKKRGRERNGTCNARAALPWEERRERELLRSAQYDPSLSATGNVAKPSCLLLFLLYSYDCMQQNIGDTLPPVFFFFKHCLRVSVSI